MRERETVPIKILTLAVMTGAGLTIVGCFDEPSQSIEDIDAGSADSDVVVFGDGDGDSPTGDVGRVGAIRGNGDGLSMGDGDMDLPMGDGDGDGDGNLPMGDGDGDGGVEDDMDGDGVPDVSDNCLQVINPDQLNTDDDADGDACDTDDDNDGVLDGNDECPLTWSDPLLGLESDPNNCGACGVQCESTESCCDGACNDVQADDSNNCGTCGNACYADSTTAASCVAGICQVECTPGRDACDGSMTDLDGCEVSTWTDGANCGSCGRTCASNNCVAGVCRS